MVRTESSLFPEPTRLILTDEGSSYFFARNQRLQRFRLLDGREEYGLQLSDYTPEVLQKLILGGLVRKLEFPVVDVVESRRRVIDYIHILAYGLVYHHSLSVARDIFDRAELTRNWLRANPKSDLRGKETRSAITTLLSHQNDTYQRMRGIMQTRIRSEYARVLRNDGQYVERDDQDRVNTIVASLLGTIPWEAWFLLVLKQNSTEAAQFVHDMAAALGEVAYKTSIADYLALMVVELLVHMQHRKTSSAPEKGDFDAPATLYLLTQMTQLPRRSGSESDRYRMHMMVSTGDLRFEALKADLDDIAKETDSGAQTFEQFYRSAGLGNENLGLYYTGFLEDACSRMGVSFEAYVRGSASDGLMNLVLTF